MLQTAAKNWAAYGNILGTNEIYKTMVSKDLIVLGLSDGVMFCVTGVGWMLQRLILRGYLSWDREGWLIQSVSCPSWISKTTCPLIIGSETNTLTDPF